jgi:hypothetical protein
LYVGAGVAVEYSTGRHLPEYYSSISMACWVFMNQKLACGVPAFANLAVHLNLRDQMPLAARLLSNC